jgi:hypothetical protein
MYFRTFANPNLQVIDLKDVDLKGGEIRHIPVRSGFSAQSVV